VTDQKGSLGVDVGLLGVASGAGLDLGYPLPKGQRWRVVVRSLWWRVWVQLGLIFTGRVCHFVSN
jgi:hypothetical protein